MVYLVMNLIKVWTEWQTVYTQLDLTFFDIWLGLYCLLRHNYLSNL